MSASFPISADERITLLTGLWCSIIQGDHHKDRDCHWSIVTKYSYGEKAKYCVEHSGYVYHDVSEQYPDYKSAQAGLCSLLEKAILSEYTHANLELKEPDEWDAKSAWRTIDLIEESQLISGDVLSLVVQEDI